MKDQKTKVENPAFISFNNEVPGIVLDESKHKKYPFKFYNVIDGEGVTPYKNKSYLGFAYRNGFTLKSENRPDLKIAEGMFFSIDGTFEILTGDMKSKAIIIEVFKGKGEYKKTNFSSMFNIGGPVEEVGRLKYIDGCTDSLLVAPVKMGDPCLNHLHFPESIDQTQHTHPSHRIGIVAKGKGECITPFGVLPLTKGMIFVIKEWDGKTKSKGLDGKQYPHGQHAFKTEGSTLDVIAFHPDSDFGATDENHPMINRTIVDGVSASNLKDIQTK